MADTPGNVSKKVLFVDDEENVTRSLKRLFIDTDIEVFTANSGKEGLEILKREDIAVIVSDQRMPEMGGAEFLEKAKKLSPNSVRMVLTGYADVNAAVDAINKGGAFRYITKPWNDNDMLITVMNAVERYNLLKENIRLTALTKKQNEELKKWSDELQIYVQQQTIDLTNQNKEFKKLNNKMNEAFGSVIAAFTSLIELRDSSVQNHSAGVSALSVETAKLAGMNEDEIKTIGVAAQLHDIGKIGITDLILMKNPAALTPEELIEYRKHSVRGQSAVDSIEELRPAGVLIRHHHEWYNGKGFPDGLKGKDIPAGARIIALADYFDRLMHGIKTHSAQTVLYKMQSLAGTQFDLFLFKKLEEAATSMFPAAVENKDIELKPTMEAELHIDDLAPGMIVSQDIKSGTGILLLSRNTVLTPKNIDGLKRSSHIDPLSAGIFIWKKALA
ncbi:MAG: response regulator [Nitrospirae bacterium]|nr:MAG: response regulator [Nitrospirota bacterium]